MDSKCLIWLLVSPFIYEVEIIGDYNPSITNAEGRRNNIYLGKLRQDLEIIDNIVCQ